MLWGWVIIECKITDGKLTEGEGVFAQGTKHARTVPECKKCKCKDCEMYHRGLLCNESFKKKENEKMTTRLYVRCCWMRLL